MTATGAFETDFNSAFQPYAGPPDNWTAEIGGNALECYIVKESLTIRMGKDDPVPVGQADTGTATFDIIGDPLLYSTGQTIGWNTNAFTGTWTDAPRATPSNPDANTARYEPSSAPDWSSAELAGKTFINVTEQALAAPGATVRAWRAAAISHDFRFDVWKQAGVSVGVNRRGRLRAVYYTANPWNSGGVLLSETTGPWVDYGAAAYVPLTLPAHTVPLDARWVQLRVEATLDGTTDTVYRVQVQNTTGTSTFAYTVEDGVADVFQPGEKVIIKRNGATIWTGWVTDEQRSWSPSTGSTSTVNAAGPRGQYNQRRYVPRWGTSGTQYGNDLAYTPLDPGPGGYTERPLADWVTDMAPYLTHGVDQYLTAEAQSYKVGIITWWKGADLELVMDILDGAANCALAQVWENRNGRLYVTGHPYYRFEAPNEWYLSDTTYLDCDEIGAPVQLRREPVYANSWAARYGPNYRGTSLSGQEEQPAIEYYEAPPNGGANREYGPSPMLNIGTQAQAADKWLFIRTVWNDRVSLEQVDRWTVRREFVDDATWTKLLTMLLGWPVVISNLPPGLFRNGRDYFHGFLWGWELNGTDEVTLTLIDRDLFA